MEKEDDRKWEAFDRLPGGEIERIVVIVLSINTDRFWWKCVGIVGIGERI